MTYTDPEVEADRRLRDATSRERKAAPMALYDWKPPVDIGAWKCRRCFVLVGIGHEDMENVAIWNRRLKQQNEAPLDVNTILICPGCRDLGNEMRPARLRERTEKLAVKIRELKESANPERELALIETIRDLKHPDVDGLLQALRETKPRAGAATARTRL